MCFSGPPKGSPVCAQRTRAKPGSPALVFIIMTNCFKFYNRRPDEYTGATKRSADFDRIYNLYWERSFLTIMMT